MRSQGVKKPGQKHTREGAEAKSGQAEEEAEGAGEGGG